MTIFGGAYINGKHTYNDYGLFLVSVDIGVPVAKTRFVDIPGADGKLDLTEASGGAIRYENRPMNLLFTVRANDDNRSALQDELNNAIHGQRVSVILDTDPDWVYDGRAAVAFEDVEDWRMKVRITVDASPYKLEPGMTEISVGADSFDQVDIYVGQGIDSQVGFSAVYDVGNISAMSKLILRWDESCPHVGPISVNVTDGTHTYVDSTVEYEDYEVEIPVSALSSADVATTDITKVLLSGIKLAKLYKQSSAGAILTVVNDRMPVCPVWENPNEASVAVHVNGKPFTISTGETINPDIVLDPGENEVAFTSASVPDDPLVLRFRKGRL